MKSLKPKIETLPLTKASVAAKTEEERKLCMDLAMAIVEGSDWPRRFRENGDAAKLLSNNALEALGICLRSATLYAEEKERKRLELQVQDSCGKGKRVSKRKGKGKMSLEPQSDSDSLKDVKPNLKVEPKPKAAKTMVDDSPNERPIVCALMSSTYQRFCHDVKGTRWCEMEPGWFPKHDMFTEDSNEESGWKKFKVCEDYDSELESGTKDVPMSPSKSVEWEPNESAFLLIRKGRKKN